MTEEDVKNVERYEAAMHGVQSSVALDIGKFGDNAAGADHKHLRTGINACLVDSSAVAQLLMGKGVFTEAEYYAALAVAAETELERCTKHMREKTGIPDLRFG